MMLLHETRNDDGIRAFFNDVWECYVKTLLNPFYAVDKPIKSPIFESKIRTIAKVSPKQTVTNDSVIYSESIQDLFAVYFSIHRIVELFLEQGVGRWY